MHIGNKSCKTHKKIHCSSIWTMQCDDGNSYKFTISEGAVACQIEGQSAKDMSGELYN